MSARSAPAPGYVRLESYVDDELTLLLDDNASPVPSGTVGGWESIEVAGHKPARRWKGPPEDRLTLQVVVTQFGGLSVLDQLSTLTTLGTTRPGGKRPRAVRVVGQVLPHSREWWVIDDVTYDPDATWEDGVPELVKLTITLGPAPSSIEIKVGDGGRSRWRTKDGKRIKRPRVALNKDETLQEFAARVLGNPSRWREVAKLNKIKDPRRPGPKGRKLRIPSD